MSASAGLALRVDANDHITQVLHDSLGFRTTIPTGTPFARLAASGNLAKALSFLVEIRARGTAFDWEINVGNGNRVRTLHFAGSQAGTSLVIAGCESDQSARELLDDIMRMNSGETYALRAAFKEDSRREPDDHLYDEISRLNNELVSMQRELSKKNAQLEHLNQEKNRFLGMAAHDLRSSLNSTLAYSEFLLDECEDGKQRQYLEVIRSSSEFMARLVDDLLDAAQIEAGVLFLDYSAIDLADLVTKNVALHRPLAARKHVDIDLQYETLPTAVVDKAKIEQVLNNLIGNAVKFSEPGSQIEVRLEDAGHNFVIRVKDSGPGIAPEQRARLFQPFQRGQAGTAGEKSIGLGLAIVNRIVEGHGGNIVVDSEIGRGATFRISIPLRPPDEGK